MNTWGLSADSGVPTEEVAELNEQQRSVLRCLARGLADHEIARVLAITQQQVAAEVVAILRALNLRDRMAAVVFAHETGIIRLPLPR
ncbi:MAG: LuxR C-terminal-related transcriptional regulator [Umezawaea sp.]